jgi:RND family efflux transporter MFP subunit
MKRAYFFLLLGIPLLPAGCSHVGQPAPVQPATVQAALVKSVSLSGTRRIQTPGTIHAKETAILSSQIAGTIEKVLVQPGDRVRAGQLLVTIDGAAMHAAVQQAQAAEAAAEQQQLAAETQASLAAQTLIRYEQLKAQHSVSPQEFDEVQQRAQAAQRQVAAYAAQRQQAAAAVAGARTQFGYATLRAPFAGIVTARMADPGTQAAPGLPLLQVDRDGPLQVYTNVDESLINTVHVGMPLPVHIEGLDADAIPATVAEVTPAASADSRSFLIKLNLPPGRSLRPGMYVTVGLPAGQKTATVIPASALMLRGALPCVYALDANGIAQLRYVTAGSQSGGMVEILSGVEPGETLVDHPEDRDLAGKRIVAASEAHQ